MLTFGDAEKLTRYGCYNNYVVHQHARVRAEVVVSIPISLSGENGKMYLLRDMVMTHDKANLFERRWFYKMKKSYVPSLFKSAFQKKIPEEIFLIVQSSSFPH